VCERKQETDARGGIAPSIRYVYVCIYLCRYVCRYLCLPQVHLCVYDSARVCVQMCACGRECKSQVLAEDASIKCVCVYVRASACEYVCVYVCVCERERE